MAIKDSGKVTITLDRTTVEKLRNEKGGMAWDAFMLNLIGCMTQGVRIKCITCKRMFRSGDIDLSPSVLAKRLGWKEVSIRDKPGTIGFLCDKCAEEASEL